MENIEDRVIDIIVEQLGAEKLKLSTALHSLKI